MISINIGIVYVLGSSLQDFHRIYRPRNRLVAIDVVYRESSNNGDMISITQQYPLATINRPQSINQSIN